MKKVILLQPIGSIDQMILNDLAKDLKKFFKKIINSFEFSDKIITLDETQYISPEKKYDGTKTLNKLNKTHERSDLLGILGIIDEDIKSKRREYVYGIAKTRKQIFLKNNESFYKPGLALISLFRLRESFYFRSENYPLFRERTLKVAIHELGHLLGLKYCKKKCIMQCKKSLKGLDQKFMGFCEECLNYLNKLFFN